jgi:hypothetical protein
MRLTITASAAWEIDVTTELRRRLARLKAEEGTLLARVTERAPRVELLLQAADLQAERSSYEMLLDRALD